MREKNRRLLSWAGLFLTSVMAAVTTFAATPIRSRAELVRYLHDTPPDESPLSLMPPGARKRFLGTLAWGRNGLGGFAAGDLAQYLTDAQIRRVLGLFDAGSYADGLHGRAIALTATERDAPETSLEQKFDEAYFARADMAHGRPHASASALYDRLLAPYQHPRRLVGLDDSDLGLLFRAAATSASISRHTRYLDDLQTDLAELRRRGIATSGQVVDVHDALVAGRRFADANALANIYPAAGIKRLPPLHVTSGIAANDPSALLMEPDGKSMLHKPIDMQAPLRIVVVAGCHFSEDAVRAIRADAQLDDLFHRHAIWLSDENESLADVLEWNRAYPDQPMNIAWRNADWSMLDSWAIPTFYVFRDGKLVDRWSGWNGLGEIRRHIVKDGLLRY